jgi:hypothetical protein
MADAQPLLAPRAVGSAVSVAQQSDSSVKFELWKHMRGCGSCRCTPVASTLCTAIVLAAVASTVLVVEHNTAPHRRKAAEQCGVWPKYLPCGYCTWGTMRPPHRVGAGDTCDSLAQQYGVPQFDLYNRNRSMSCCQNATIAISELVEICRPPTVAQWRAAGHPRALPPPGKLTATYVGAMVQPGTTHGLRELPDYINVAYLGGVDDSTNTRGEFSLGVKRSTACGSLTDNCSARGVALQSARHTALFCQHPFR